MKKYKLIDLFCGVGGISQGFHWAGFETVIANEYDNSIGNAFKENFPNTKTIIGILGILILIKSCRKIKLNLAK